MVLVNAVHFCMCQSGAVGCIRISRLTLTESLLYLVYGWRVFLRRYSHVFRDRRGPRVSFFIVCQLVSLRQGLSVNVELGWHPAGLTESPLLSP